MQADWFSTQHIDYLQRNDIVPSGLPTAVEDACPPGMRRLYRVRGVGQLEKLRPSTSAESPRPLGDDLVFGLYGSKIPLAFLVAGEAGSVAVHVGTWSPPGEQAAEHVMDARQRILGSMLESLYPYVDLEPVSPELPALSTGGYVLGVPSIRPTDVLDQALPIDRVFRAMSGRHWAVLVLAAPWPESGITHLRHSLINEMRKVASLSESARAPDPLSDHYLQLLEQSLGNLALGQAVGAWKTAVYLMGDVDSYNQLASAWRGIHSGSESLIDPLRVWPDPAAAESARSWSMHSEAAPAGPGSYEHPFQHETLLNSTQLAAYVQIPALETSGFTVSLVPAYDAEPKHVSGTESISIGMVIHGLRPSGDLYEIDAPSLRRHAFVAGLTGSGKTNTIFHLLKQAGGLGVPFLVIEPAKTEYRQLIRDAELAGQLNIFTVGDETVSPLRLNPFEVLPGTPVGVHIDLLRAAFGASFGMWTPLPQVLEQCLHRVYEDRGWQIDQNENPRLTDPAFRSNAFPTLTDLIRKVDEIVYSLGYDERVTTDLRAALITRLNALRSGAKGRMLDVNTSLPVEVLVSQPTILELEQVGDDDDKALLMALLLVQLAEFRRSQPQSSELRHVLVIEEAHRLFENVAVNVRDEQANPRGKAVETFSNLLSEIRASGQGVIIADQIPARLAPDVIKNTNLKIAHRIVARDDRETLGGAMAMDDRQTRGLSNLELGQAAVFSEGDDAPLLVQVPAAKGIDSAADPPTNDEIASAMMQSSALDPYRGAYLSFPECAESCVIGGGACEIAKQTVEDYRFVSMLSRLVLSTIEEPGALDRMWYEFTSVVSALRPPGVPLTAFARCMAVRGARLLAERRGAQSHWSYADTVRFGDVLRRTLFAKMDSTPEDPREEFRSFALALMQRTSPPYFACDRICDEEPKVCKYRYAAKDLVKRRDYVTSWLNSERADVEEGDRRAKTWQVCLDAAYDLIEFPEEDWPSETRSKGTAAMDRTALCFAQQMLHEDPRKSIRTSARIIERLFREKGH